MPVWVVPKVNNTTQIVPLSVPFLLHHILNFTGVAIFIASVIMAIVTLKASKHLHMNMLKRILKAPMSFFDTTPTGRIVNRFGSMQCFLKTKKIIIR